MQVLYLSDGMMVLSFFIVWPLLQISITLICNKIKLERYNPNSFFLRSHKWENNGQIYRTVFKIHKWKHFLPDGAKAHKKGFEKKEMKSYDSKYINEFIFQTGRAEITHWAQIIPFWVFGFWCPPFVIILMFIYALLVNIPCILAQRYNRPRLIKIYNLKKNK